MSHPPVRHLPGRHCASSGLRDVCAHHGLDLSEAMCFGLGAGLGLWYFDPGGPSRMVHVRSADLEERFFTRVGVPFAWERHQDPADSERALILALDKGLPVLLQTDIFHLPYYESRTHFPGHVVVAWGHDLGREVFFVTDTERPDVKEVPFADMRKARYGSGIIELSGNQFAPRGVPRDLDLGALAVAAIRENSARLLDRSKDFQGLAALEKWFSELILWESFPDWAWTARFAYQTIERRGTGGGGFRLMYADFLDEAAALSTEIADSGLAPAMRELGCAWTGLAMALKEASEREAPDFAGAREALARVIGLGREIHQKAVNLGGRGDVDV